ncbi:SpoIID/LytB domain-containing protein [Clostridium sp. Cult2]|uniref:SpoIID/LytB domain-containing protein n=1 Tax=Clostridium sp. Cult2 TaxID=2079003 RepID=UPI001F406B0D|nr:SpoIID/LytB domain-containing protein [Clostridium sp. Cult2]MCF6465911.1 hypothetical protein [Clostridium sp. Cult2]
MRRIFVLMILMIMIFGFIFPNHYIYANPLENNFLRIRLTSPIKSSEVVNLHSEEGFFIYSRDNLMEYIESIEVDNIKVTIKEEGEIYILDIDDNLLFSYNHEDDLIISSKDEYDKNIKVEDKTYRDYMSFKIVNGNLILINYVDIDNYLYGVVPREMPTSFEMEALKAQAIAARTYALKNINKHNNEGYDLCDTTHCQVYGGMDGEQEKTNRAVDETKGMIITYNGDVIDALYHANSGGLTEGSLEAWGNNHPYLISVDDRYSMDAPNSNWSLQLTAEEISSSLKNNGMNIGDVIDIEIIETSSNGRVTQLKIIGTLGEKVLMNSQIRLIFGTTELKSTWFTIQKGDSGGVVTSFYAIDGNSDKPKLIHMNSVHVIDGSFKPSSTRGLTSRFINRDRAVDISDNSSFIIEGKGYGHGVGMSQWGAQRMAESGYSYEDILKHYYNGVEITITE